MLKRLLRPWLAFADDDPKVRRLVRYWGLAALLYLLCIGILWVEVLTGSAQVRPTLALTVFTVAGQAVFFVLIRHYRYLAFTPAQLSELQGRFAIVCTIAGYAIIGPFRGATLLVLVVILVFCAFTLESKKTHALSMFAVALLGAVMLGMCYADPSAFDPAVELKQFVLVGTMVAVVGFLTGRMSELRSALKAQKAELTEALRRIEELATRDELTALPNRRYMSTLLSLEERRCQRAGDACLALLDIDWFKKINDVHGHAVGDRVLQEFAQKGRTNVREDDVLARWGGEEFLLYLPRTCLETAGGVLERLCVQIRSLRFEHDGAAFGITFSAGLVALRPGESIDVAIRRADALLYRAKEQGRDRVITDEDAAVQTA